MNSVVDIGLVVAMKEEADILASAIGLAPVSSEKDNHRTYMSSNGAIVMLTPGTDPQFICNGKPVCRVGKVSAGVATTLLLERFAPRCIINAGTAGGLQSAGMSIGDIVLADSVTSHDIRIPIAGYKEYGIRKIPVTHLSKLSFLTLTYKIGPVSSGESFASMSEEWKVIKKNKALAKDMEAAGVLQTTEILGSTVPVYVIKSITDVGDEHVHAQTSSEDFRRNFSFAMKELSNVIKIIVENKEKLF